MYKIETSVGRQICSLPHPSTVKNFPHPHWPTQSFPSQALIPHNQYTFPQFPVILFRNNIVDSPVYVNQILTLLSNVTSLCQIVTLYHARLFVFCNHNAAAIYHSSLTVQIFSNNLFLYGSFPFPHVFSTLFPSPVGFPTSNAGKFPCRSLVRKHTFVIVVPFCCCNTVWLRPMWRTCCELVVNNNVHGPVNNVAVFDWRMNIFR